MIFTYCYDVAFSSAVNQFYNNLMIFTYYCDVAFSALSIKHDTI